MESQADILEVLVYNTQVTGDELLESRNGHHSHWISYAFLAWQCWMYSLTWARGPAHMSPALAWFRHHSAIHTASALDRD